MVGYRVCIVDSEALREISLEGLIGLKGVVLEDLSARERRNRGYLVRLDVNYMEEDCWFVPVDAVRYEDRD